MKNVLTGSLMLFFSGALIVGCNTSDYADDDTYSSTPATTTSNDTTMSMPTNTNAQNSAVDVTPNEISKDSSATATPVAGNATPNPNKKGKRGSVVITMEKRSPGDMETVDKEGYYTNVYPAYPGGDKALANFFQKNLDYPADASENGVEGTVKLSFTVDENGKVGKPQITSPSLGYGLEQEALRVFSKMPAWKPGALKGKNVKTRFTLPVKFSLED